MSAVVASVASAQTIEAEFETASGTVTATTLEDEFTFGGSLFFTCNHAEYEGTFVSPTRTLKLTPKYAGCLILGGMTIDVIDTGCTFDFTLRNEHNKANPITKSAVDVSLNCAEGGHVIVTATSFGGSTCTITVGPQKLNGTLGITRMPGPPADLALDAGALGFTYTVTKSGVFCPTAGHHSNGGIDLSQITLRAFSDSAHSKAVGVTFITS